MSERGRVKRRPEGFRMREEEDRAKLRDGNNRLAR
jgi:hypothetical protein